MRPRPDAAEKVQPRPVLVAVADASMRPRPDAAEKAAIKEPASDFGDASMRPRPDAAEKTGAAAAEGRVRESFNEAAARCRGKAPSRSTVGGWFWLLQ